MKFLKRKTGLQALAWLFLFALYFNLINYFQPLKMAMLIALYNTLTVFFVYQITVKVLFPRYYSNKIIYFAGSALLILSLASMVVFIDTNFVGEIHNSVQKPPKIFHYLRVVSGFTFSFFVGTSVSLMQNYNRMVKNEKLLKEEKLSTELKLLKAQINPHFIFNALNNIYSLTYMKSENAPDSVLKLSQMLRYVFYDCSKDKVSVQAEVRYMENFIAFQKMKSDVPQNIDLKFDKRIGQMEVAPMLFIPFIENAFKYSRIEEDAEAFVRIKVGQDKGRFSFDIENSVATSSKPLPGSGMGIKNVKHRLAILYQEKSNLEIEETAERFRVSLTIES